MKTFVINLERSPDRLFAMREQMDQLKLSFDRVAAIDGRDLTTTNRDCALSEAEIACHMSHRLCWQRLLESGANQALILEDDIIFSNGAGTFLKNIDALSNFGGIIRLERPREKACVERRQLLTIGAYALHRIVSMHYGGAAYIIDRITASTLMRDDYSRLFPVDILLFALPRFGIKPIHEFQIFQMVPAPCIQRRDWFKRQQIQPTGEISQIEHRWSPRQDKKSTLKRLEQLKRYYYSLHPRYRRLRIDFDLESGSDRPS